MAGTTRNAQFNPYLSPAQQDLLLAALSSNNPGNYKANNNAQGGFYQDSTNNSGFFDSPYQQPTPDSGNLDNFGTDDTPFIDSLDFLDADGSQEFDEDGPQMIGNLPGDGETDRHEKRKSFGDHEHDDDDHSAKRQEGDDNKTAKKPGRKPLTSEPTTKRKAQNRAAQRAFRERKEKHLKDLETKVQELEKASEAANHENGLLKAQVDRLQTELREYRKRLSLNGSGLGRSPPRVNGGFSSYLARNNGLNNPNNFQFDFPKFGSLPGAHIFNNGELGKAPANGSSQPSRSSSNSGTPTLNREASGSRLSPKANGSGSNPGLNQKSNFTNFMGGNISRSPQQSLDNPLGNLFSPSILSGSNSFDYGFPTTAGNQKQSQQSRTSTDSSNGIARSFQFNANSASSNTDSPSASSVSQYGPNSSCGTSPEPSHNSPSAGKLNDNAVDLTNEDVGSGYICHGNSEGEIAFCEKLNMACGNPRNPVPRAKSFSNGSPGANNNPAIQVNNNLNINNNDATTGAKTPGLEHGFDWLASQNGGQFDPVLFGGYRETQDAVLGNGEFTGGFFNEAFPFPTDFGSPFNINSPPSSKAQNLLEEVDKAQNGEDDDEVVPADDPASMLSCNKIWDRIQDRPDFKDGSFDIDGLCSELRAKARCSESGVVVDSKDVDAALKKMPFGQKA